MADAAFNITKGRVTELAHRVRNNDPATAGFVNPEYAELARDRIRDDAPLLNTPSEVAA